MSALGFEQLAEAGEGDGDVAAGGGFLVLVEGEVVDAARLSDGTGIGDELWRDGVTKAVFGAIAAVDTGQGDGGVALGEGSACFLSAFCPQLWG